MRLASDRGDSLSVSEWNRLLRPYTFPCTRRSLAQLAVTLGLFFSGLGAAFLLASSVGYWASLPLAFPTGLLLVRIFIIQHDCGHRSFFRQRWACDVLGRFLAVLTFTPFYWWKKEHDLHHATSGDLSRRGHGDINTLTVAEFDALPRWRRLLYRLYRHPLVLFGVAPIFLFLVLHRLPIGTCKANRRAILSVIQTNFALAAVLAVAVYLVGFGKVLMICLPVMIVADVAGVWIFFVQHQFAHTYWERGDRWSFVPAVLGGCSYYKLPRPVEWLTGSIGYHHIHHLAPRIPNYRLRECFRDIEGLRTVQALTFRESLRCAHLALWCEERRRLVPFSLKDGPSSNSPAAVAKRG